MVELVVVCCSFGVVGVLICWDELFFGSGLDVFGGVGVLDF